MKSSWMQCGLVLAIVCSAPVCIASMAPAAAQGLQWAHSPALDAGVVEDAEALATFDDGSGRAVYVGGRFHHAGGMPIPLVARWNGASWSAVGQGLAPGTGAVTALYVHDQGSGPALYAGGSFSSSGTTSVNNVARWNGSAWTPLGTGTNGHVDAFTTFDDGAGPALYVGGSFTLAGGVSVSQVARWDGTAWSALPPFPQTVAGVSCLAVHADASGTALYAGGGRFGGAGQQGFVARLQGTSWTEFTIFDGGTAPGIHAVHSHDDGTGSALYVAGYFQNAGGMPATSIAKRTGAGTWSPLSSQIGSPVFALVTYDDGTGRALFAGGGISAAGGVSLNDVARFTPAEGWSPLGAGLGGTYCAALCVASLSAGSPPDLYATGEFLTAGSVFNHSFARWTHAGISGGPFCTGDLTVQPCPCNNWGPPGSPNGCKNSTGLGGRLVASGQPSIANDTLVLDAMQLPLGTSALFFQGTLRANHGAGVVLGDGLRCAGGSIVRLGTVSNGTGSVSFPLVGGTSIHVAGGVSPGTTRTYQVHYRDAAPFCTPSTFNLTNGWIAAWTP